MLVDVVLEEDEAAQLEYPMKDDLLCEQMQHQLRPYANEKRKHRSAMDSEIEARKLFRMCDGAEKGFMVKEDLIKIDGFIGNMPIDKLEMFFDSIDTSRTNIVTESQFIENIKPILSRMENNNIAAGERQSTTGMPTKKEANEETKGNKTPVIPAVELSVAELEKESDPPESFGLNGSEESSKAQTLLIPVGEPVVDFQGSLHDELAIAQIGRSNGSAVPLGSRPPTPFSVENKVFEIAYSQPNAMESRLKPQELRDAGETSRDDVPVEVVYSPHSEAALDRIFKVVFVGDSAVGKTCFLHRFCHNRFKPLFNATIGVDFTVKTIKLKDKVVAVQLWDTAGQERFRSITKQYFRKADGVIVMYDVTSEQSFLNVRNWISSVQAGVDESCVLCLLGNKVDLYGNHCSRVLTYQHGQQLADEYSMLFFETSAYTGYGVRDCMKEVAEKLKQKEDDHLVQALKLDALEQQKKKSWCCL